MEIANLEIRNTSLLLRWWWKPYTQRDSLWSVMAFRIRGIAIQSNGPCYWAVRGSFFWKHLIKIKHIFHWSAVWQVRDGKSISFWYDNWMGKPIRMLKDGLSRPRFQHGSLCENLPLISDIAPFLSSSVNIALSYGDDFLSWRWSHSGSYSANSIYKVLISGGKIRWRQISVWDCFAPLKVKFFGFLTLRERILTHDVMERRGIWCDLKCVLCNSCLREDALHLLFHCPYALHVWSAVSRLLGVRLLSHGDTIQQIWDRSEKSAMATGSLGRKEWGTRFLCTIWFIWRRRNEKIFRAKEISARVLTDRIKEEGDLRLRFCCARSGERVQLL